MSRRRRQLLPGAYEPGGGGPDKLSSLRNNHVTILHSSLHKYIHAVHDLHCILRFISTYTISHSTLVVIFHVFLVVILGPSLP